MNSVGIDVSEGSLLVPAKNGTFFLTRIPAVKSRQYGPGLQDAVRPPQR